MTRHDRQIDAEAAGGGASSSNRITAIHLDDVPIERMEERDGWAISEFRLPVSGRHGSETTAFHSIFRPGSTHAKHLHHSCDEIAVYLKGHGVVGQGNSRAELGAGHCRLMPRGSEHFYFNETTNEDAVVVGFYVAAANLATSGYEYRGHVLPADLEMPRSGLNEGILVRLQDIDPLNIGSLKAYSSVDVRLPIGRHNGSSNALIQLSIGPGRELGEHLLARCQQLYFLVEGAGVVRSGEKQIHVRKGHFILVPKQTSFGLQNAESTMALEAVGVLTGAGSLAEAGYSDTGL